MNTRNRPGDNALLEKSQRFVDSYADAILRISYTYLKSTHDAEDICQTVFLKCLEHPRTFHDEEHEKAWVIRCTINACKDALGKACRKTSLPIEAAACVEAPAEPERTDVLDAVMALKVEYREAIYLHYFEGYSIKEIAELTGRSAVAVGAHLSRGRKKLRSLIDADGSATASSLNCLPGAARNSVSH